MKSSNKKKQILIIDDHPVVRIGLRQIISLEDNLEVCGEGSSANEAINLISRSKPDLVIVDISLDGDMSGLQIIKAVKERYSSIKTLVISMHEKPFMVDRAIRAGASGYLVKKYAYNTIIDAIKKVLAGDLYLSETMAKELINKTYNASKSIKDTGMENLTNRELEIFHMIGSGHDTKDIARKLGLAENTIQTFKRHIREKLGIKNHNDLVRKAAIYAASTTE